MAKGNITEQNPTGSLRNPSGTISDSIPQGTIDLESLDFPRVVQFALYNVTSTTVDASFELDRNGDFVWAVYKFPYNNDADATPTMAEITNGLGAIVSGTKTAIKDAFTEFTIINMQPSTQYEIFFFTDAGGNRSTVYSKQFIMNEGDVIFGDRIFEAQFEPQFE